MSALRVIADLYGLGFLMTSCTLGIMTISGALEDHARVSRGEGPPRTQLNFWGDTIRALAWPLFLIKPW